MRFALNIRELRKTQLLRVIAMLFLLHSGVDMLFPEMCTEEPFAGGLTRSVLSQGDDGQAAPAFTVSNVKESQDEQRSDPQHKGEDCFCCCSHVMPSPVFAPPDSVEHVTPKIAVRKLFIPSAPPDNPYHPPRLA